MGRLGSKDMRALGRKFRPGYHVVGGRAAKFHVVAPDGSVVRSTDGQPISLPNTPTFDAHYRRRVESQLRKAGVIE